MFALTVQPEPVALEHNYKNFELTKPNQPNTGISSKFGTTPINYSRTSGNRPPKTLNAGRGGRQGELVDWNEK